MEFAPAPIDVPSWVAVAPASFFYSSGFKTRTVGRKLLRATIFEAELGVIQQDFGAFCTDAVQRLRGVFCKHADALHREQLKELAREKTERTEKRAWERKMDMDASSSGSSSSSSRPALPGGWRKRKRKRARTGGASSGDRDPIIVDDDDEDDEDAQDEFARMFDADDLKVKSEPREGEEKDEKDKPASEVGAASPSRPSTTDELRELRAELEETRAELALVGREREQLVAICARLRQERAQARAERDAAKQQAQLMRDERDAARETRDEYKHKWQDALKARARSPAQPLEDAP